MPPTPPTHPFRSSANPLPPIPPLGVNHSHPDRSALSLANTSPVTPRASPPQTAPPSRTLSEPRTPPHPVAPSPGHDAPPHPPPARRTVLAATAHHTIQPPIARTRTHASGRRPALGCSHVPESRPARVTSRMDAPRMDAALLSAARFASLAPARTEMLEDGSERIGAITSDGGPELSIPLLTSSLAILVSVRQYPPYSNGQLYVLSTH